jgi:hypothetical protein
MIRLTDVPSGNPRFVAVRGSDTNGQVSIIADRCVLTTPVACNVALNILAMCCPEALSHAGIELLLSDEIDFELTSGNREGDGT